MHHLWRAIPVSAALAAFFWSTSAHAQATEIAKKLLEEAKKLKEEGKIPEACPLLDRSYELDAKDGVLFARADCRDQERKIAAAVNLYEAYLRAFKRMTGATKDAHSERAATAEARVKELGPRVPMVKFIWAQQPPANTMITVDRIEFRASTLESLLPLEPGTHEIIVNLPGEPERKRTVTLAEGGSTIVDLTPLPPKTDASAENGPPTKLPKTDRTRKPVPPSTKSTVDPWKVGGFVGVGLGVAGMVAGSVTGALAIQEKDTVEAHCNGEHRCDKDGLAAAERFQTIGNVSTAAFIAGGVLAAVGATLVVVSYRGSGSPKTTARIRTTVAPGVVQIGIEGAF